MKRNPHTAEILRMVSEERMAPIEIVQRMGNVTYSQVYNVIQRARREGKIPHITTWGRATTSSERFLELATRKNHISVGRIGHQMTLSMSEEMIFNFVKMAADAGYSNLAEAAVDIITEHMFEVGHGTEQGRSSDTGKAAAASRPGN